MRTKFVSRYTDIRNVFPELLSDITETKNGEKLLKPTGEAKAVQKELEQAGEALKKVGKEGDARKAAVKKGRESFGNYSTIIDSKVTVVEKQQLPSWLVDTFKNGIYRTVVTNEDITVYHSFGYNAEAGGAFATSSPALSRVQTKVDSAILPEWENTLRYEAEIVIPKGTILNIGRVGDHLL